MKRIIIFGSVTLIMLGSIITGVGDCGQLTTQSNARIDVATGHKYVPNPDGTFTEYSKKGELLRNNVPSDLPLLSSADNIKNVAPDTWILYEKAVGSTIKREIRQASDGHPAGWRCKGVLRHAKALSGISEMGYGYHPIRESISYEGLKLTATGSAYYDIATGHRYIRNPDGSYCEFSKKGQMLRPSVPNTSKLLTVGKYIYDISGKDYIVYEKKTTDKTLTEIIRATNGHPTGYSSRDLFSAVN